MLVPPFLFATLVKESFRQPKLLASEWFALASLAALAWGLRRDDAALLAQVNESLAAWRQDGTLAGVLARWLPSLTRMR